MFVYGIGKILLDVSFSVVVVASVVVCVTLELSSVVSNVVLKACVIFVAISEMLVVAVVN